MKGLFVTPTQQTHVGNPVLSMLESGDNVVAGLNTFDQVAEKNRTLDALNSMTTLLKGDPKQGVINDRYNQLVSGGTPNTALDMLRGLNPDADKAAALKGQAELAKILAETNNVNRQNPWYEQLSQDVKDPYLTQRFLNMTPNEVQATGNRQTLTATGREIPTENVSFSQYVQGFESNGEADPYAAKNGKQGSTAQGKYQVINDTNASVAKRLGLTPDQARTPQGQELVFGALQQEYAGQLKSLKLPVTNENMYAIHQLGYPRAERLFKGTLTDADLNTMKDNLPKNLQNGDIRTNWINHYMRPHKQEVPVGNKALDEILKTDPNAAVLTQLEGMKKQYASNPAMAKLVNQLYSDLAVKSGKDYSPLMMTMPKNEDIKNNAQAEATTDMLSSAEQFGANYFKNVQNLSGQEVDKDTRDNIVNGEWTGYYIPTEKRQDSIDTVTNAVKDLDTKYDYVPLYGEEGGTKKLVTAMMDYMSPDDVEMMKNPATKTETVQKVLNRMGLIDEKGDAWWNVGKDVKMDQGTEVKLKLRDEIDNLEMDLREKINDGKPKGEIDKLRQTILVKKKSLNALGGMTKSLRNFINYSFK